MPTTQRPLRRRLERGFTLIELLVVVVILGLLATVVMQNLLPETDKARVETVRTQMTTFESAVERFTLRKNAAPRNFEELIEPDEANGGDSWLKTDKLPEDPWGSEYRLEEHPERRGRVLIISAGPDKEFDTEDDITTDNMRSYKVPSQS